MAIYPIASKKAQSPDGAGDEVDEAVQVGGMEFVLRVEAQNPCLGPNDLACISRELAPNKNWSESSF